MSPVTPAAPRKHKIVVFGILFWYPLAGVTFQFLHYLIGLRRLGYDVYYVEDSGRWVYDPLINDMTPDVTNNISAVRPVLEAHGFAGKWAYRGNYPGGGCHGMTECELLTLYRDADAFLNVTGSQELRDEHMRCPIRIYVESDPFTNQVGVALGHADTIRALAAHTLHFSFGENLGQPDCTAPVGRFEWIPTRQPVVMDLWRDDRRVDAAAYTTITTWHNKGKNIEYNGDTYYWTKDREFLKLIDLPKRTPAPLELALGIDDDIVRLLSANGWRYADSARVSRDPSSYRDYIAGSRGEFTVARDQYVRPKTGWFSDRSACYLAAGRPVITQETGFSKFLPTGEGLFGFADVADVLAAIDTIETDYARARRRARDIAAEYFGAENVLRRIMARAGF